MSENGRNILRLLEILVLFLAFFFGRQCWRSMSDIRYRLEMAPFASSSLESRQVQRASA